MARILYCASEDFLGFKLDARRQNPLITDVFEDCEELRHISNMQAG